jgi:hypothetical protein
MLQDLVPERAQRLVVAARHHDVARRIGRRRRSEWPTLVYPAKSPAVHKVNPLYSEEL